MTDHELHELLKSVQPPGHAPEYWEQFPGTVTSAIQRPSMARKPAPRPLFAQKLFGAWAVGVAVICVLVATAVVFWRSRRPNSSASQLAEITRCYREMESLFPNQVEAIIFDQQGPHLMLAPKANVPSSPPLYIKMCGPKGCAQIVTFSGEAVPFNGQRIEVLADAQGQVMLVGNDRVWAGDENSGPIRIQARPLQVTL